MEIWEEFPLESSFLQVIENFIADQIDMQKIQIHLSV